jgi:hypothetical protein
MGIREQVKDGEPENARLDYKAKASPNWKIAKNLTAFANAEGGTVVIGVREESGKPDQIEHIPNPHQKADEVSDTVTSRVSPPIDFERLSCTIEENTILGLKVAPSDRLHSFEHPNRSEEPVFPQRHTATTRYLSGQDVNSYFEPQQDERESHDESADDLLRLPDKEEELSEYFIKSPDGHISDICIFTDIYYPDDPVRVWAGADGVHTAKVEDILARLAARFELDRMRSAYTINQSNAAWVGQGIESFATSLRSQDRRYREAEDEYNYEVEKYGNEQAILVGEITKYYPESVLIIYVAPFVNSEGYRHVTLNFILDGPPADNRPLIEFSENAGMPLSNIKEVEIPADGIKKPSRIQVDVLERISQKYNILRGYETDQTVTGAICANPFQTRLNLLSRELDLDGLRPLAAYDRLYGYLIDWEDPDNLHQYETKQFGVRDWNEFTRSIYANVKEVSFKINW